MNIVKHKYKHCLSMILKKINCIINVFVLNILNEKIS